MAIDVLIEPDERGRVTLSKLPGTNASRYLGRRLPDGSIRLVPVVVLSTRDVEALVSMAARPPGERHGRPLADFLAERGIAPLPDDVVAEATERAIEARHRGGGRSLADLTPGEVQALRDGRAGFGTAQ